jgi:hypothetical protein
LKTHEVYLEEFDKCSICYSEVVSVKFEFFPRMALTHQRLLWLVKFALETLEGTVVSEAGIPDLSHIPMGKGQME